MWYAVIYVVLVLGASVAFTHLVAKYGQKFKFKDLITFEKGVVIFLWGMIAIWFAFLIYAITTFPIVK